MSEALALRENRVELACLELRGQLYGVDVHQVREIVRGYPGRCSLHLLLVLTDGHKVHIKSGSMRIDVCEELRKRIDNALGAGNYQLITSAPKPSSSNGGPPRRRARARN